MDFSQLLIKKWMHCLKTYYTEQDLSEILIHSFSVPADMCFFPEPTVISISPEVTIGSYHPSEELLITPRYTLSPSSAVIKAQTSQPVQGGASGALWLQQ